ncbi:hypothetical protein JW865_09660 [Candidatus Bathyarchaeota archaeon]|nr:hypothetical protein [Candidatus Bathyarchaeota archaeon]
MAAILIVDPALDTHLISLILLLSLSPIVLEYKILLLSLLAISALFIVKREAKTSLSLIIALILTISLKYLNYSYAVFPLIAFLLGVPPFHKWLKDLYSHFNYTGIYLAFTVITVLYDYPSTYSQLNTVLQFLSLIMMINSVFHGVITKSASEHYSSLHQMLIGLCLNAISLNLVSATNFSLVISGFLILFTIQYVYNSLFRDRESSIFYYGGLSNTLKTEAFTVLMCYTLFFSQISQTAENIIKTGLTSNVSFIINGSIILFVAAGSLAVFYRSYTIVFEGYPRNRVNSLKINKIFITLLLIFNIILSVSPSILGYNQIYGKLSELNILLLLILTSTIVASIITSNMRARMVESWTTGYTSMHEIQESKDDPLKAWRDVFRFVYSIKIPDEEITSKISKINSNLLYLIIILLTVLEVVI